MRDLVNTVTLECVCQSGPRLVSVTQLPYSAYADKAVDVEKGLDLWAWSAVFSQVLPSHTEQDQVST